MNRKDVLLSVIIVDYFKAKNVLENVSSILKQKGVSDLEIIIIDNSCDSQNFEILKTLKKKSEVKLIKSSCNIGYSKANNLGVSKAKGQYIAIVNPDIIWTDTSSIIQMITVLQKDTSIGIIGPQQKEINGSWALNVRKFPNVFLQIARRTFLRYISPFKSWVYEDEMQSMDKTKSQDVDWLQSSCYLLSRELWNTIGGFEEKYFLFLADTQMCVESWQRKKRVYFFADTQVLSDGIRCSDGGFLSFFTKKSLRIHFIDSLKYMWKNFGRKNPRNLI